MKRIYYLAAFAAVLGLATSCGTSKKTLEAQNQMMMQQMMMQNQRQSNSPQQSTTMQQPSRTVREKDPCTLKAEEASSNLRVVGISRSFIESSLRSDAINNAQIQMAQLIRASIEGAINDYNANATKNLKLSSEAIIERTMETYVVKEIKNTRIIETAMYDLSDGSIQMYVCLEMSKEIDDLVSSIDNAVLSDDAVAGIKYDRDRFKASVAEGLAKYKEELKNK